MSCCKEAKARAEALIQMGCIVTGRKQGVVIHHLREGVGMGMRAPWWRTIPLLASLHDANFPYSVHGRDRERFFQDNGDEESLLARVNARLPPLLTGPKAPPPLEPSQP